MEVERPDQVWSTDITYIPLAAGFMYLTAIIDWYSRYVLSWRLSNTLDGSFCMETLEEALRAGKPEIFNTDQGVQFTAGVHGAVGVGRRGGEHGRSGRAWTTCSWSDVEEREVRGHVHPGYETVPELERGLGQYFGFYNDERLHQSLEYRTPAAVYGKVGATRA